MDCLSGTPPAFSTASRQSSAPTSNRRQSPRPIPQGAAQQERRTARLDDPSWLVDAAISGEGTPGVANDEPLLLNTPSSWSDRPDATTAVPNLFLAADYVRSNIDLATMEGRTKPARPPSGASASQAKVFVLYEPPELKPFWDLDDVRYLLVLPNQFDALEPDLPWRPR
jgi:hypothetical protein